MKIRCSVCALSAPVFAAFSALFLWFIARGYPTPGSAFVNAVFAVICAALAAYMSFTAFHGHSAVRPRGER